MLHTTNQEHIERKNLLILRILREAEQPLGARIIARRMEEAGIAMSERTVRYHLKLMDERGLTRLVGHRDGRAIAPLGMEELENARVRDKLGFVISRIENLAFRTTFDPSKGRGLLPVNITLFPEERFKEALDAMGQAFDAGICVSELVSVRKAGERFGDMIVPKGKFGFATVCSIVINGVLLKTGVPMDSKFGGILQVRNGQPLRFTDMIFYSGSSLDPSEAFIRAKMTSVREVARKEEGKILANFREVPVVCRGLVKKTILKIQKAGIGGVILMGEPSEPACQVPVDMNKIGLILMGGLNPVACAEEAGIESENRAMSNMIEYQELRHFTDVRKKGF